MGGVSRGQADHQGDILNKAKNRLKLWHNLLRSGQYYEGKCYK